MWGGGLVTHYISDSVVWPEGGVRPRRRRVFVQTVHGDEKWEGGKVNMGHSRALRHVLPSGWKSK